MESALQQLKESLESPSNHLTGALGSGPTVDKKKAVRSSYDNLVKLCKAKETNSADIAKAIDELTKALKILTKQNYMVKSPKYRSATTAIQAAAGIYSQPLQEVSLFGELYRQNLLSRQSDRRTDSRSRPSSGHTYPNAQTVTSDQTHTESDYRQSYQFALECDMKGASGEDHSGVNWFCITCCFNLCNECKIEHESKGKFARHDMVLRRELFHGVSKSCINHPTEFTFVVCAPCREAVCKTCITESHLGKEHYFAA